VLIGFELDKSGVPSARDLQLIDPRSGAVRNTVRGATGVGWLAGGGQALLAQEGADRTAFVLVDPAGRTRVVGSVAGVGLNCQARDDVLACAAPSGLLRVWRLPMVTWAENR
jgi:hypothetical protein